MKSPFPFLVSSALMLMALAGCGGEGGDAPERSGMPADSAERAGAPVAGGGYKGVEVKNGGTIMGRVVLAGRVPALEDFAIPSDQSICAPASENNRLVMGHDGGIASAVVYLEGIREGKPMPELPAAARTMDQRNCLYVPHVLAVPVGDTALFLNSDELPHNVRVEDLSSEKIMMNVAQPKAGNRDPLAIERTGPVLVGCDYHPWMNAYVFGVDNPYYVVTDTTGAFRLDDIPPGTYTVKMWLNGFELKPRKDNQGKVIRYAFGEPILMEQKVTVAGAEPVQIAFRVE